MQLKLQINSDHFNLLLDDVASTVIERGLNRRDDLITTYHIIGQRIVTDPWHKKGKHGNKALILAIAQGLAKKHNIKLGQSLVYECTRFYEKNPDIEKYLLSQPKNLSWSKVRIQLHGGKLESPKTAGGCRHCLEHCPKH